MMNRATLDDIFDEETWAERGLVARHRIIGVFDKAVDPFSKRGTDNYVVGASDRIENLSGVVMKNMHHRHNLIVDRDLSLEYAVLPKSRRLVVCAKLSGQLIAHELVAMRDEDEIYYQDGRWQACQSLMDEYGHYSEIRSVHYLKLVELSKVHRVKWDKRPDHGRPRQQTKRRGVPEGTSISYA